MKHSSILLLFALLILMAVGLSHAQQGPTVIIAPNGAVTYLYPGTPAIAISPNGGVSTIYPTGPAPVVVLPQTPVYVPPAPVLDWSK